ncbi:MAG: hypothetical protein ACFFED_10130 [Candidatus Thorarchaeota archaeon]
MKRRDLATIIIMGVVIVSLLFFSARLTVPLPRQHSILYTYSSYNVEEYPEYYFTPLDIEPEQEVYVQYSIDIGPNDEMEDWAFEMYQCDLATFLAHYTPDDDPDSEFRSDYLIMGGWSTPLLQEDLRLGTAAIEGHFILVWWIDAIVKDTPWSVTMSVYTLI